VAERARIVLFAACGLQDLEIAARMAITPKKVSRWRKRFLALGVPGLQKDAPRPGRKPTIGTRLTKRVVTMTTRQQPVNATHWSTRTMAAAAGISEASVRRTTLRSPRNWKTSSACISIRRSTRWCCAPTRRAKFKLWIGPNPGLPLKPGCGATMTHDYKRKGAVTLFAALNAANGEVFGLCQERHRHQEWLKARFQDGDVWVKVFAIEKEAA
jgi:hypothetical protein